jgi:ABC-type nickel/cobalt efflux system permease component RcnA
VSAGALLLLGLLFGMQHATEADHLAAVATLVAREKRLGSAVRQGVFWGLGHSLTLLSFGGAVMVVGIALSDRWVHGLEGAVGVMLVLLGGDLMRRLWRDRVHFHAHAHSEDAAEDVPHFHAHSHKGELGRHDSAHHRHEHRPVPLRALLVGMMHGLAGSAALVLLTLQQVRSPMLGLVYVLLFGVGSVVGMAVLSAVVSVPMRLGADRLTRWHRALNVAVGLFSVALGLHVIGSQWM